MNKKKITIEEYNKRMDKIINKNLPVHESLMALMDEASKYEIINIKKKQTGRYKK